MTVQLPDPPPRSPQHLQYQGPGAHQKSQWVTDEGTVGKILVGFLIVASILGTVLAGIGAVISWYLGWW